MSPEGSAGLESRIARNPSLNGSLNPSTFYAASPLPSKSFVPHRPSLLRHSSGPQTASPTAKSTFQVVISSSPSKTLALNTLAAPSTAPKKRGRPFKSSQGTPAPVPMPKKKGRPFRTPEAAAAALARARVSTDDTAKKRGRPFKYALAPEQLPPIVPPEPKFVPFLCEWDGCPAELHNLDTLRAHLLTVHLKKQRSVGSLTCRWRNCCQDYEVMEKGNGKRAIVEKGAEFKTPEEWMKHVNVAHIDPVAWHQGDGPKVTMSFFASKMQPDTSLYYLYDVDGRQVTPLLKSQPIEEGRAKDNNVARFQKQRDGLYVVLVPIDDPKLYMNGGDTESDADMDDT